MRAISAIGPIENSAIHTTGTSHSSALRVCGFSTSRPSVAR